MQTVLELYGERVHQHSRIEFQDKEAAIKQYSVILAKDEDLEFSYNPSAGWSYQWTSYPEYSADAIQIAEEPNDGARKVFKIHALNTGYACIKLYQHDGPPGVPIHDEVERWIGVVVAKSSVQKAQATKVSNYAVLEAAHRRLSEELAGSKRW